MATLPSHTSYAFQPLNVACFKPFKIIWIKKERHTTMGSKNYIELDKITLARWVDKALEQSLTRKKSY
jgi:hypothetical protein